VAKRYDAVVIGAGHNGLVCAAYLARAGRSVLVVEAAERAGGAAVTRSFAPGYSVSGCAHLLRALPRRIARDLALARHGLRAAADSLPSTVIGGDTSPLVLGQAGLVDLARRAPADAQAYVAYSARMRRLAAALAPVLLQSPPAVGRPGWRDGMTLLGLGARVRLLGRLDMQEVLRILPSNVADLLDEHFASDLLKGGLAFDAVLGGNHGPRAPGTVLPLLHRLAAEHLANDDGLALPQGGMGAVAEALVAAARAAGAEIRLAAPVARIAVREDRAAGVVLQSGEEIAAGTVVSNVDPRTTLLRLLGAEHLDTGFVRRVHHLRAEGMTGKLHLALSGLPMFRDVPADALRGRLLLARSIDALERAHNPTKYRAVAAAPPMEITLPTLSDPSLAPAGHHVLSAVVQYLPYVVEEGWAAARVRVTASLIDTLDAMAPGLRAQVVAAELLAPPDIEAEFRIAGGHWHHAELAFDQYLMLRPVPGAAQYCTPVSGVFLCGAGSHPGGGITGTPGRNAAAAVLRQAA
jgi:phytoene dehydrogenase-like protein